MKLFMLLMFTLMMTHPLSAQYAKDSANIHATVLNYVEGWYDGDSIQMAKAIHPKLAKRIIGWSKDITKNENVLEDMNYDQLLDGTGRGYGKNIPKARQTKKISILSVYTNTASVKVEMSDWIDFLHLGRWNGEWKIINILWERKPQE